MDSMVFELLVIHLLLLSYFPQPVYCRDYFSTANLSTIWTNNDSLRSRNIFPFTIPPGTVLFQDSRPSVGCGFLGYDDTDFYFSVFAITPINSEKTKRLGTSTQVLWSANRNRPVKENATLEFTSLGDLVLKDVDGGLVWSTNTSGSSVVGMGINATGNLILHDENNKIVWQSFDHPTDTWVSVQRLSKGQRLVADMSDSNTSTAGSLYVELSNDGLCAYMESQLYATYAYDSASYLKIEVLGEMKHPEFVFTLYSDHNLEYISLDSDGHIRGQSFRDEGETVVTDILGIDACAYPMVCGRYGICSDTECTCPSYFEQIDFGKPSRGCVRTTQLSLDNPQHHILLQLGQVDYFNFIEDLRNISIESCKDTCLQNLSCQAAIFRFNDNSSNGGCSLRREVFSLMTNKHSLDFYNSTTFLKVQDPSVKVEGASIVPSPHGRNRLRRIMIGTFSTVSLLLLIIVLGLVFSCMRKKVVTISTENNLYERGWDSLDQISGMPKRFSFADLNSATTNFSNRLGGGGFGSVFEGHLEDGEKIAVKRLMIWGKEEKNS